MVFQRKRFTRRPVTRRPARRRRFKRRVPRRYPGKIYYFKRSVELPVFPMQPTSNPNFFAYSFKLDDVPGVTEFTSLFDQFCLTGVSFKIIPAYNISFISGTSVSSPQGEVYTVIDYTDSYVPTSLDDLAQSQTLKRGSSLRINKRYFRPRILIPLSATTGGTMVGPRSMWLTTGPSSDEKHYGIKGAVTFADPALVPNCKFRISCTYYLKFKQVT
ncbi:putative capsid protein [uncultured virus]|uniref:Putative capsid protein n=1 Tax=uncultured virus TaxID=340016 RepID=A0A1I9XGC8_9VIRU|nr:putative capsid protein [uncultured virus]